MEQKEVYHLIREDINRNRRKEMQNLKEVGILLLVLCTLSILSLCVLWHQEKGVWLKRVQKWSVTNAKRLYRWIR